jgi:hypothetical protein
VTSSAILIAFLAILWVVLLILTIRPGEASLLSRLVSFELMLFVTILLGYFFLVDVVGINPNPYRVSFSRSLLDDKGIYLGDVVPGIYDLNYINRIDTDWDKDDLVEKEWVAFYQYDVRAPEDSPPRGPFGGAIYDSDRCRPPVIYSFELVPVSYDYLGQDSVSVTVGNIIPYKDPLSWDRTGQELDRPEVIIVGTTSGVVTDLNIFRKVGWDQECEPRREVQTASSPYQTVTVPYHYQVIGTFRGNYVVNRNGATVTVVDRAGFERSQIVARRVYTPDPATGSYLVPASHDPDKLVLRDPDWAGLGFGPGRPDDTREVYYPEKALLAFFLDLGGNSKRALSNTCQVQNTSEYHPERFGLTLPLRDLQQVVVCELGYIPDIEGEQNHDTQLVRAKVVEVPEGGSRSCELARSLECVVEPEPDPRALPYGCEWCIQECYEIP